QGAEGSMPARIREAVRIDLVLRRIARGAGGHGLRPRRTATRACAVQQILRRLDLRIDLIRPRPTPAILRLPDIAAELAIDLAEKLRRDRHRVGIEPAAEHVGEAEDAHRRILSRLRETLRRARALHRAYGGQIVGQRRLTDGWRWQ